MANSLNVLIPVLFASLNRVLRQTGFLLNVPTLDAAASAAAVGQTVNIGQSAALAPYDVTPAATPPALTDTTPTAEVVQITRSRGARFHLTGEDWRAIDARGPEFRVRMLDEALAALIHEMASYVWSYMDVNAGRAVGAAGTNPFATDPNILMDAWRILSDAKAPESDRIAAISTLEWASAGKLPQFQKLNEAPPGVSFATARLGMLASFMTGWDQGIGSHVAGTAAGYLVNNGAGYPVGATAITLDTGANAFLPGDVVHFATDTTRKYVVKSWASAILTLQDGLEAAVADNATVTVQASHRSSILAHRDAFVLATRVPAEAPDGDVAAAVQVITDPITGIGLRLANYKGYHASQWEASLVYGIGKRRSSQAVKLIA
jgi:hypothetical protein